LWLVLPPALARTSTVPALAAAGASSVHSVEDAQLTLPATPFPNLKLVPAPRAKPVPVTVTGDPPAIVPVAGLRPVTVGASYVNRALLVTALWPLGVSTVTSTAPVVPAGEVAVIEVEEPTAELAAFGPKRTLLERVKFVPVMTTAVPPDAGPFFVERRVTAGGGPSASISSMYDLPEPSENAL
jgi:hypothetical protein